MLPSAYVLRRNNDPDLIGYIHPKNDKVLNVLTPDCCSHGHSARYSLACSHHAFDFFLACWHLWWKDSSLLPRIDHSLDSLEAAATDRWISWNLLRRNLHFVSPVGCIKLKLCHLVWPTPHNLPTSDGAGLDGTSIGLKSDDIIIPV